MERQVKAGEHVSHSLTCITHHPRCLLYAPFTPLLSPSLRSLHCPSGLCVKSLAHKSLPPSSSLSPLVRNVLGGASITLPPLVSRHDVLPRLH